MTPPTNRAMPKWKSQHNYAQMASSGTQGKEALAELLGIVKVT